MEGFNWVILLIIAGAALMGRAGKFNAGVRAMQANEAARRASLAAAAAPPPPAPGVAPYVPQAAYSPPPPGAPRAAPRPAAPARALGTVSRAPVGSAAGPSSTTRSFIHNAFGSPAQARHAVILAEIFGAAARPSLTPSRRPDPL